MNTSLFVSIRNVRNSTFEHCPRTGSYPQSTTQSIGQYGSKCALRYMNIAHKRLLYTRVIDCTVNINTTVSRRNRQLRQLKSLLFNFVYRATRWHVHCTKQNFTKIQLITLDLYHHLQRSLSACTAATENQHATRFERIHHCSSAPCPPGLLSAISSPFHSSCPSSLPPSASNFDWQGWRWKNSAS